MPAGYQLCYWEEGRVETFGVPVEAPIKADDHQIDPDELPSAEEIVDLDAVETVCRRGRRDLQRCVTNAKATVNGDPLNIVVVGTDLQAGLPIRAGWGNRRHDEGAGHQDGGGEAV